MEVVWQGRKYRLQGDRIQFLSVGGEWKTSAWTYEEFRMPELKSQAHPLYPMLEALYGDDPNGR